MIKEEADRLGDLHKSETATIQEIVGSKAKEYHWRGRRFSTREDAAAAVSAYVRDVAIPQVSDLPPQSPIRSAQAAGGAGKVLFGIFGAVVCLAVAIGLEVS